ncbi:MAG: hypothetical protein S4CHLAM6_15790 [Chlamydiae bacterium]|nr:hypothetical protein [Chlamydiota bacterium]
MIIIAIIRHYALIGETMVYLDTRVKETSNIEQLRLDVSQRKEAHKTLVKGFLAVSGAILGVYVIRDNMDHTAPTTSSALAAIPENIFGTCMTQICTNTQLVKDLLVSASSCSAVLDEISNISDVSTHSIYGVGQKLGSFVKNLLMSSTVDESVEFNPQDCLTLLKSNVARDSFYNNDDALTIFDLINYKGLKSSKAFSFAKEICESHIVETNDHHQIVQEGLVELSFKMGSPYVENLLQDSNYHGAIVNYVSRVEHAPILAKYGVYPSFSLDRVVDLKRCGLNYSEHKKIMDALFSKATSEDFVKLAAELARGDTEFLKMLKIKLPEHRFALIEEFIDSNPEPT